MSDRRLFVNCRDEEERRIALVCDGRLTELWIEHPSEHPAGKRVMLGRVGKIVPSLGAAFVNIGEGRDGLLPLADCPEPPRSGSELIVQVDKPPRKNKGARLTARVAFAGKYCVYLPCESGVTVSRKLEPEERKRLKEAGKALCPAEGGLILRTDALEAPEDALRREIAALEERWAEVKRKAQFAPAPALLWADDDLTERVLRDYLADLPNEIVTDDESTLPALRRWTEAKGGDAASVRLYRGSDLFADEGLDRAIEEACRTRVPLPCGGELVIETTEALTAVDVNSARGASLGSVEEQSLAVNLEAARELAHQVRLRNLAGLIVVDFIDLKSEASRNRLFEELQKAFAADREHLHLYPPSPLGLVELSRRRRRPDLRGTLRCGIAHPEGATMLRPAAQVAELKRLLRRCCRGSRPEAVLAQCGREALELVARGRWKRWEEELGLQLWLRPLEEFDLGGCRVELTGDAAAVAARAARPWGEEVPRVYRRDDFERL